jgi:hypothetical protein
MRREFCAWVPGALRAVNPLDRVPTAERGDLHVHAGRRTIRAEEATVRVVVTREIVVDVVPTEDAKRIGGRRRIAC